MSIFVFMKRKDSELPALNSGTLAQPPLEDLPYSQLMVASLQTKALLQKTFSAVNPLRALLSGHLLRWWANQSWPKLLLYLASRALQLFFLLRDQSNSWILDLARALP
jgi:hypothetical protein